MEYLKLLFIIIACGIAVAIPLAVLMAWWPRDRKFLGFYLGMGPDERLQRILPDHESTLWPGRTVIMVAHHPTIGDERFALMAHDAIRSMMDWDQDRGRTGQFKHRNGTTVTAYGICDGDLSQPSLISGSDNKPFPSCFRQKSFSKVSKEWMTPDHE